MIISSFRISLKKLLVVTLWVGLFAVFNISFLGYAQQFDYSDTSEQTYTSVYQQQSETESIPPPVNIETSGYKVGKPLSASISKSLYLPPDMYGHWSVTGTLIDASSNSRFNPIVHDIWILEKQGDQIVVTNPVTNASASIEVDKVDGNTATFHRMMVNDNKVVLEMPTLTVEGDSLTGINIYKSQRIKNGKIVKSYYGKYRLEAKRIGRSRVKFRDDNGLRPQFEIEEVQFAP